MNLQKAEQAVKNAQNQLDEAMRQLEAAKDDGWSRGLPKSGYPVVLKGDHPAYDYQYAVACGEKLVMLHGSMMLATYTGEATEILKRYSWRYAEKGEVNISW